MSAELRSLAACAGSGDKRNRQRSEGVALYPAIAPEGAGLAAAAGRAAGATMQVTATGIDVVGVKADGALWACRTQADGTVAALVPPGSRQ